eukprot:m.17914 g.17914  ORF g.17914 m.17914 type:complete len:160 (+) comp8213_c1_seq1:78-557(+)
MPLLSKVIFELYDDNNSGTIEAVELKNIAAQMGYPMTDEDIEKSMKVLDVNDDGVITYEEFKKWWQQKNKFGVLEEEREKLERADHWEQWLSSAKKHFHYFDKDKSGYIRAHEFEDLYNNLQKSYNLGTVEEARDELDANSDGVISLQEYIHWLKKKRS